MRRIDQLVIVDSTPPLIKKYTYTQASSRDCHQERDEGRGAGRDEHAAAADAGDAHAAPSAPLPEAAPGAARDPAEGLGATGHQHAAEPSKHAHTTSQHSSAAKI